MNALRYFDVGLVLVTAPFIAAAGLPFAGYAIAAGAWIVTRLGGAYLEAKARQTNDARAFAGLTIAGMMGRVWVVALAIVTARVAVSKDDGITAAVLSLAAFTVYFVLSTLVRQIDRKPIKPIGSSS
jgi:hypothetical protein